MRGAQGRRTCCGRVCQTLEQPGPSVTSSHSPRFAGAFTLRQRMLNFVQNIQYYMMFEVMEPTWHVLERNLRSVSSAFTCRGPEKAQRRLACLCGEGAGSGVSPRAEGGRPQEAAARPAHVRATKRCGRARGTAFGGAPASSR